VDRECDGPVTLRAEGGINYRSVVLLTAALFACLSAGLAGVPTAAAWSGPAIRSGAGDDAESPKVAVDRKGDAVAVWTRSHGAREAVEGATRSAGGAWSKPVRLSAAGNAEAPEVAVDQAGEVVAVWQQARGGREVVESAARTVGGGWSQPVDLSAPGRVEGPEVAVGSTGEAVAVWVHSHGARYTVQSAARPAGGSWSAPADLSVAAVDARNPEVAVDPAGDAVTLWQQARGGNDVILVSTRPAGGSWSAPAPLSAPGQNARGSQVALDPFGDAVAVWQRSDGAHWIVQSAMLPAHGSWSKPVNLSAPGRSAGGAQVAVDQAGDAVAVWSRSEGSRGRVVQSARLVHAWSKPVDLSRSASAYAPEVAAGPKGAAVAVWTRRSGAGYVIQSARLRGGHSWSKPVDLSDRGRREHDLDLAVDSHVAMDGHGRAVAVWQRSDGAHWIIQSATQRAGGHHRPAQSG
jgi:hypothetical protein